MLINRLRVHELPYEVERDLLAGGDEAARALLRLIDEPPVPGKQWPSVHAMGILFRMRSAMAAEMRAELYSTLLRQTRREQVEVRSKAATLLVGWLRTVGQELPSALTPTEQSKAWNALRVSQKMGLSKNASALASRALAATRKRRNEE